MKTAVDGMRAMTVYENGSGAEQSLNNERKRAVGLCKADRSCLSSSFDTIPKREHKTEPGEIDVMKM